MRARQMLSAVALIVLVGLTFSAVPQRPAAASQQTLSALLPKAGQVSGWKIVPEGDLYAANPGKLSVIYDGGDGEYIRAGVTEALSRTYQSGKTYLTVRIHKLGSDPQKAKAFYANKEGSIRKAQGYTAVPVKNGGCYAPTGGLTVGFSWTGPYMVTYVATTTEATSATKAFILKVSANIAEVHK